MTGGVFQLLTNYGAQDRMLIMPRKKIRTNNTDFKDSIFNLALLKIESPPIDINCDAIEKLFHS